MPATAFRLPPSGLPPFAHRLRPKAAEQTTVIFSPSIAVGDCALAAFHAPSELLRALHPRRHAPQTCAHGDPTRRESIDAVAASSRAGAMPCAPSATSTVPFPARQLFILGREALCRICEPIAFMSIFPYIYYMIASFHITHDERQIAVYAGLVTSAFALAEFSASVFWGRLSDRVGRKPVLIGGLAGTGLSMLVFGFAKSLPVALLARALGGLLNGNIGVLQTTVAEIVTVKEHQPRAYAIMPFVWCLGSIIGPAIGGTLADPSRSYPSIFKPGSLFDRFPYLLPNLICTIIVACGVTIGILFLEETHPLKKTRPDLGRQTGRWILNCGRHCRRRPQHDRASKVAEAEAEGKRHETNALLAAAAADDDDQPPGYRSTAGSPRPSTSGGRPSPPVPAAKSPLAPPPQPPPTWSLAFNRQVVLLIVGYGILAYGRNHTMAFEQLMPVMLSTPPSSAPPVLPFKFLGGFGLSAKTIGIIISFQGLYSMTAQLLLFPVVVRWFGTLRVFQFVVFSYPLLYFFTPYLVLLHGWTRAVGLAVCLAVKVTAAILAYPSHAIQLANSAPSSLVLGLINGVAASSASLSRAFGPTVSGLIHSAGLTMGYSGLAWWSGALIASLGALESLWMANVAGRMDPGQADEETGSVVVAPLAPDPVASLAANSAVFPIAAGKALHPTTGVDAFRPYTDVPADKPGE
ncbi:MAG: hypothetical protein M1826_004654 [Phylliscum demangeonii]|nr:MAG: hypothetical protein M1826_004654 [Phylliscum demangeonii]